MEGNKKSLDHRTMQCSLMCQGDMIDSTGFLSIRFPTMSARPLLTEGLARILLLIVWTPSLDKEEDTLEVGNWELGLTLTST